MAIQSDALGNVTSDGYWTFHWEGGRRLSGMTGGGTSVSFKYDENGQRIRKSYAGVTTDYTVQGKRIVHVKSSDSTLGEMHIYYDGDRPDMVLYDGATYRYVHSLQGDILGLQDSTGAMVVVYRYDPWGRPVWLSGSMSDTLGALNPFRYRGYVYDAESGLYYLRSRYYNPNWGRFLSADDTALLGTVNALFADNLFTYCRNNPVMHIDTNGKTAISMKGIDSYLQENSVDFPLAIADILVEDAATLWNSYYRYTKVPGIYARKWSIISESVDGALGFWGKCIPYADPILETVCTGYEMVRAYKEGRPKEEIGAILLVNFVFYMIPFSIVWAANLGALGAFAVGVMAWVIFDGIPLKGKTIREHSVEAWKPQEG